MNASGAVGVTVTGNNGSPKKPSDIVIKDNSLASKGGAIGIELYRVENCVLENNTISGFDAAVSAGKSEGEIQADIDVTYTE